MLKKHDDYFVAGNIQCPSGGALNVTSDEVNAMLLQQRCLGAYLLAAQISESSPEPARTVMTDMAISFDAASAGPANVIGRSPKVGAE